MTSYTSTRTILSAGLMIGLFCVLSIPVNARAASTKPSCVLTASTSAGVLTTKTKDSILLPAGETVEIAWKSKHAKSATVNPGGKIASSGVATQTPSTTTTYSYRFVSGSKSATCALTVHVVSGTITQSTAQKNSKAVLSGTASGTKSVQVRIYKEGAEKALYTSKVITVKKNVWKTTVTKKLPEGTYTVVLSGEKKFELNTITEKTLTVGNQVVKDSPSVDTTLVVAAVPLLIGGTARGGSAVSVSYLQVINVGNAPALIQGFTVKQNGSASTDAIIGLTISDDAGVIQGTLGEQLVQNLLKIRLQQSPHKYSFLPET
ncbi:hypothetical protein IPH92_03240 [Candidatus Kaiserbacteria bacterium]|nr:MAG: hypothetical protein IPH92_03240 [Candidatus Kaiserbacteria bacterium]